MRSNVGCRATLTENPSSSHMLLPPMSNRPRSAAMAVGTRGVFSRVAIDLASAAKSGRPVASPAVLPAVTAGLPVILSERPNDVRDGVRRAGRRRYPLELHHSVAARRHGRLRAHR